jgi:cobalt-zinc-cadmium efflux system outer membrane protein
MKQPSPLKPCRRFVLVALVASGIASAAGGAETAPASVATNLPLSLDALVGEALEKNPEVKFYEGEMAAARAGRQAAGRPANPELSAGVGHKSVASSDGVAWSVSLMQPFEWPGRLGLRKAIANRDLELAGLGLERFKTALAARVRTLGYGLFGAQEKAAAAREVAERFKVLREILVQRDPAGLTPLLETRVIEATELNAQRRAGEATLAARSALFELNQLRGSPPDAPLSVGQTALAFRAPESREELLAFARTNNFEVRLRAVELAQQGFRVDLANNERFPAISVGPSISEERAGDRERVIGVGLSLPLPLWNRNTANLGAAKARQMQAETSLYLAQREVERQVLQAALSYETKLGEMANWRPDSVQHFQEAAELADRHYRLGAVPIATYIELQKQYLEAVESLLDTRKEALEAAVQLELLTGLKAPLTQTTSSEENR